MEKLERDGLVAVVYNSGYGAGWSSWQSSFEYSSILCMDKDIASAVLRGDKKEAARIAKEKCPNAYCDDYEKLSIEWVPKGYAFEIECYDGKESVNLIGHYLTA